MARPSRDVPAYLPMLSSARNIIYTLLSLTTAAGLKTSFSSHLTVSPTMGQMNLLLPASSTEFASSAFTNGARAHSPDAVLSLPLQPISSNRVKNLLYFISLLLKYEGKEYKDVKKEKNCRRRVEQRYRRRASQ